jgi:hypothetical protein
MSSVHPVQRLVQGTAVAHTYMEMEVKETTVGEATDIEGMYLAILGSQSAFSYEGK